MSERVFPCPNCSQTFESSFDVNAHIRQEHLEYDLYPSPITCSIVEKEPKKETILDTAQRVVDGDRNLDYGRPDQNHGCTGEMYGVYRARRIQSGHDPEVFDALDVCVFNICQKLSRLAHTPSHIDSLVDIAGYARNYEMILERG